MLFLRYPYEIFYCISNMNHCEHKGGFILYSITLWSHNLERDKKVFQFLLVESVVKPPVFLAKTFKKVST